MFADSELLSLTEVGKSSLPVRRVESNFDWIVYPGSR